MSVQFFELNLDGSLPPEGSRIPCTLGSTHFGCSAYCSDHGYPVCYLPARGYPYQGNPISLALEADYLLDVVPQEMNPSAFHSAAIAAQAVAARTYVYHQIYYAIDVNNSTQHQVFLPYRFESLNPAADPDNPANPCASTNLSGAQSVLCAGMASGLSF